MAGTTKKMLWRDIRTTFKKSRGRFLSIVFLIALGSFALVGLKVAGPDMRVTSSGFFAEHDMADLTVIGGLGIDKDDEADIERASDIREVEYGYLKDVTVKGTNTALRVESAPERVSGYEVSDGRMPQKYDEIALDVFMADEYPVGSRITLTEKADAGGSKILRRHSFKVVGHVSSTEIISLVNMGKTTVGTGDLMGYAVVQPSVFDCDYHMVARLTFKDTEGLDPYGDEYLDKVSAHRKELRSLLEDAPERRLSVVRSEYDKQIDEGQDKVDAAYDKLSSAKASLDVAATQIADAANAIESSENQLADAAEQLADGRAQLDASWGKLVGAKSTLDAGKADLAASEKKLASAAEQLSNGWEQYRANEAEYNQGEQNYADGKASYDQAVAAAPAQKQQLQQGIDACRATIDDCAAKLEQVDAAFEQVGDAMAALEQQPGFDPENPGEQYLALKAQIEQLEQQKRQLEAGKAQAEAKQQELEATYAGIDSQLAAAESELTATRAKLDTAKQQLAAVESALIVKQAEYERGRAAYAQGVATYNQGLSGYYSGLASWQSAAATLASKTGEYDTARAKIASAKDQLASKQAEYEDGLAQYNSELPDAQKQIADAESKLEDARADRDKVERPAYSVDSRRETPGAEGYKTYDSVSEIIDSLANIFPYFMYLVAALVASTTMTRMVDEERINSGTLKALGYSDGDIMKKFAVYGAAAGAIGSVLGIATGHTLLPLIVYNAYGAKFSLPRIVLQWHPGVSLAALALGLAVSVVPAVFTAKRLLSEKPAQLLLPKAPAGGSKILLERIKPLWSRLSFTQKVTCRNLLRYKKRMIMTVVGVSGAVCLMFCGFAVRNSIDRLSATQFGDIIRYDLIVAENSTVDTDDRAQIAEELDSSAVKEYSTIRYESISKVAGAKGDEQEISLLVPQDEEAFTKYLDIRDRKTGGKLQLTDDGAIISERLATLAGVEVGDTLTFTDADGAERSVRIEGICEMYMNHFMLMSPKAYCSCFGKKAAGNAYVIALNDSSIKGTRREAARFMKLDGVLNCVQSAALINQIDVIVKSLNKIMLVLILVAVLLAMVIVYNLVTINVAERIRELSTIKVLGFFGNEVSMYIYRETIINSLIALPVGWLLGWLLQQYIITAVPPENVMFDPACGWLPFAVSAFVVVTVVAVMYLVVNRQLRNVDMLEALKSVD